MSSVLSALVQALSSLFHSKILALLLWPVLVSALLWVGIAFYFWGSWIASLSAFLVASPLASWIAQGFLTVAFHYLVSIVLVLLLLPAIYVTALLFTAIFGMPAMVDHVAGKCYPLLEKKQGGTAMGSLWNSLIATAVYFAGWLLSLPLWLFSPFALVLPILFTAYLNQRLFRYDALALHASREEFSEIVERAMPKFYLLGAVAGLLQLVPFMNLFSPVYIGLAFTHLCLSELQALRNSGNS